VSGVFELKGSNGIGGRNAPVSFLFDYACLV
jgi:hypothetical protein